MSDRDEALTLYTVYVETITANEQRRAQLAAIYLSLFAAGGAAFGALKLDLFYAAVPALLVSIVWLASIRYFRRLASAKFKVIAELEDLFGYKPFGREWHFYKGSADPDEKEKKYLGLAHLDMMVPFLFVLVSGAYVIYRVIASTF